MGNDLRRQRPQGARRAGESGLRRDRERHAHAGDGRRRAVAARERAPAADRPHRAFRVFRPAADDPTGADRASIPEQTMRAGTAGKHGGALPGAAGAAAGAAAARAGRQNPPPAGIAFDVRQAPANHGEGKRRCARRRGHRRPGQRDRGESPADGEFRVFPAEPAHHEHRASGQLPRLHLRAQPGDVGGSLRELADDAAESGVGCRAPAEPCPHGCDHRSGLHDPNTSCGRCAACGAAA